MSKRCRYCNERVPARGGPHDPEFCSASHELAFRARVFQKRSGRRSLIVDVIPEPASVEQDTQKPSDRFFPYSETVNATYSARSIDLRHSNLQIRVRLILVVPKPLGWLLIRVRILGRAVSSKSPHESHERAS